MCCKPRKQVLLSSFLSLPPPFPPSPPPSVSSSLFRQGSTILQAAASVRPVPHFSFSNEKRCLEEPSCAQYPIHSRYGQRKICTTVALARTFDGRALACGRWCFTQLAIKICDFVRRALHSGSREQYEFRSQKWFHHQGAHLTSCKTIQHSMHCQRTIVSIPSLFINSKAEGLKVRYSSKLLILCSQGAHPTSSKTKSHTVFVALIETHCNHAELAHQFESRGVEGPIF